MVVLPAPLGPTNATNCPGLMLHEIFLQSHGAVDRWLGRFCFSGFVARRTIVIGKTIRIGYPSTVQEFGWPSPIRSDPILLSTSSLGTSKSFAAIGKRDVLKAHRARHPG